MCTVTSPALRRTPTWWNVEVFAKNVWNERGYTYQQGAFGYDQIGFGTVIYPRRVGMTVRYRF